MRENNFLNLLILNSVVNMIITIDLMKCTETKEITCNEIMKWEEPYSSGSGTWHKNDISPATMKGTIFIH
jgi:thiazole synthase ThiGH ThiG subunit